MKTLLLAMVCMVFMLCLTTQAQLFSLITEPPGGLDATPSYRVMDSQSPIEFSYATPDTPENADDSTERVVIIFMDFTNTNMNYTACYIGNGQIQTYEYMRYNDYLVVKSIVTTGQFFNVLCSLQTPEREQPATNTTAFIYELTLGHSVVATPSTDPTEHTLAELAERVLGPVSSNGPRIGENSPANPENLMLGGTSKVTLPPVFTSEAVFAYTYQFTAGQRLLFNSTEIALIREKHFEYLQDRTRGQSLSDVMVLDQWAALDMEKGKPEYLYLTLYTRTSTSQYDFKLGLQTALRTFYKNLRVPIDLVSLTHNSTHMYNSHCFNDVQDFTETSINCGGPGSGCSHCYQKGDTCTTGSQCASGVCLMTAEGGECEVEYGTRKASSAVMHFSAITTLIMLVVAMVLM